MFVRLFIAALATLLVGAQTFASAGTVGGGGGQGIVCKNKKTGKRTVTLLDLWEAKATGTKLMKPTKDLASEVDAALVRLTYAYPLGQFSKDCKENCFLEDLRKEAAKFLTPNKKLLRRHGETIALTADTYSVAWPTDCPPQQLVNYQPTGFIWRNEDLFDDMDLLNKAALIVHESLYAVLRAWNDDNNSIRTRRAVGYVFSGKAFEPNDVKVPRERIVCYSTSPLDPYTLLTFFQTTESKLVVNVRRFAGQTPLGILTPVSDIGAHTDKLSEMLDYKCPGDVGVSSGVEVDGPIEFDRSLYITRNCENGRFRYYISGNKVGSDQTYNIPLKCVYGVAKEEN